MVHKKMVKKSVITIKNNVNMLIGVGGDSDAHKE